MKDKIRTLFIGTSNFAVPILDKLLNLEYIDLVGIITQPDRPAGRKQELTASDVKQFLLEEKYDIEIFQPEKLKLGVEEILNETSPELIIVASYGQFIPKIMLDFPKFKCLNIHGSVLPLLRGAVPIPMSILQRFETTGVSIQIMSEGMDEGDVIGISECKIDPDETTTSLTLKLSGLSADLVAKILPDWIEGKISPLKQDETEVTFCYQKDISKENAKIDFEMDIEHVDRMIRAFDPWPIAWFEITNLNTDKTEFIGKKIKVYSAKILNTNEVTNTENLNNGRFFKYNKMLCVKLSDRILQLEEIQMEGKKRLNSREYLFLV